MPASQRHLWAQLGQPASCSQAHANNMPHIWINRQALVLCRLSEPSCQVPRLQYGCVNHSDTQVAISSPTQPFNPALHHHQLLLQAQRHPPAVHTCHRLPGAAQPQCNPWRCIMRSIRMQREAAMGPGRRPAPGCSTGRALSYTGIWLKRFGVRHACS